MATSIPHFPTYFHKSTITISNDRNTEVVSTVQELYTLHRAGVYRVALKFTRNTDDAEDVVQNVFLRMMRNGALPDLGRSPGAYLKRAAANAAIDLIRKRMQMAETVLPMDHHAPKASFVEERHVTQVLERLSPENAKLFEMHYRGGFKDAELANSFGIKVGTVKSRLNRIRAALQRELVPA